MSKQNGQIYRRTENCPYPRVLSLIHLEGFNCRYSKKFYCESGKIRVGFSIKKRWSLCTMHFGRLMKVKLYALVPILWGLRHLKFRQPSQMGFITIDLNLLLISFKTGRDPLQAGFFPRNLRSFRDRSLKPTLSEWFLHSAAFEVVSRIPLIMAPILLNLLVYYIILSRTSSIALTTLKLVFTSLIVFFYYAYFLFGVLITL